jgi:hypothetical protein
MRDPACGEVLAKGGRAAQVPARLEKFSAAMHALLHAN